MISCLIYIRVLGHKVSRVETESSRVEPKMSRISGTITIFTLCTGIMFVPITFLYAPTDDQDGGFHAHVLKVLMVVEIDLLPTRHKV
jgi:hypothetical protein